jgi:hypothetical protein
VARRDGFWGLIGAVGGGALSVGWLSPAAGVLSVLVGDISFLIAILVDPHASLAAPQNGSESDVLYDIICDVYLRGRKM